MKRANYIPWLAAVPVLLLAPCAGGQETAATRVQSDLDGALKDLQQTRSEQADLRRALYREINDLDDRALDLGKQLRTLEQEEELRSGRQRSLERELAARKVEMDYVNGVLKQYSQALLTRLHPAENQLYREELESATRRAEAVASSDLSAELTERISAARTGLRRLAEVNGGTKFSGKALRNGSETLDGTFAVLGPAVFFAGGDRFEGVATFAQTGTELPTVVALQKVGQGEIANAIENGSGLLPFDSSMGKAIEVEAANESLAETLEKGGVVGYAIMLLGAVAFGITIFKAIEVGRFPVPSRTRVNTIIDDLVNGEHDQARRHAADLAGLTGEMIRTGVELFYEKRRVLEEALFEKMVAIKPRLDRLLPFLGLTAAAAPLMGLLGTVLGIIKTFKAMAIYGTGNAKSFSAGISEALITTAQGLVVAIPVLVLHGLTKSYAKGKFSEIEALAISFMNGTTELDKGKVPAEPPQPANGGDGDGDDDLDLGAIHPQPAS